MNTKDLVDKENDLELLERKLRIENEDKKEDQIRSMAWFALWGMLLYPFGIMLSSYFAMDKAASLLADIAPTYFMSISVLVAAFFGAEAYKKQK